LPEAPRTDIDSRRRGVGGKLGEGHDGLEKAKGLLKRAKPFKERIRKSRRMGSGQKTESKVQLEGGLRSYHVKVGEGLERGS